VRAKSHRKDVAKLARQEGWSIEVTGGGHVRLTHPRAKRYVIASYTTTDWHALKKVRAAMRRALRPATT
jgi:predicted RNA binding protein YcfA (HicA-like mRNA interferase family)